MATSKDRASDVDPIVEEGLRLLDEDPELRADLDEFGTRLARGEVTDAELMPHAEVLRRLKRLGLPVGTDEHESE
jgi:hypothetical protein